jgi:ribose 5-phosphate isomerase B
MNLYIASDHGGFELKNKLLEYMREQPNTNFQISDLGAFTFEGDDDYTNYAFKLAEMVSESSDNRGILICKSGIGVCIAANKVKGIYAGLCFSEEHAERARQHNNINVLCLDSEFITDLSLHKGIVRKFLDTEFSGVGRHERRNDQIKKYESEHFKN